jgi:adenine-specific DNA-methyltransferase
LTYTSPEPYDLIIGNPPYFVIPKKDVDVSYWSYFTGRPNIFNIFIAKSLSMLAENGILCFVLPKSFLNCVYYDNTRSHIYNNYNIIAIEACNDAKFIDTAQETVIFTIQKNAPKNNSQFTIVKNGFTIFHDPIKINMLHKMYQKSTTLDQMGFNVGVGTVVWNQVKSELTHDKNKTMLIYSSNVEDNKIIAKDFKNNSKKQYIDRNGKTDTCLIVNRGYGNGEYKFQYAIVNQTTPYLLENHIICITLKPTQPKITKSKLLKQYQKITESFDNEKTRQFISMYFSNNAINTTELQHILPIY